MRKLRGKKAFGLAVGAVAAIVVACASAPAAKDAGKTAPEGSEAVTAATAKIPANWTLYIPGSKNPADPKADIEAQGFATLPGFSSHFSFIHDAASGRPVLKLDTTDGKNDFFRLPLAGTEKRITLVFKAKGSTVPDRASTPFGIFWAGWQRGRYQAVLRHNASNQVKGSSGQTSLKPDDIVSDWHDFRLVFEVADDGKAMTATAFIDGQQRHQTKGFVKDSGETAFSPDTMSGAGNFVMFGENDGSTNGYGRYPYLLVIKDEDVSAKTLGELSAAAGFDLAANPDTASDSGPVSLKPAKKPAGINMSAAEASSKDATYVDPSFIKDGALDPDRIATSKTAIQKVNRTPSLPAGFALALTVDPSGAYKTIASAIDAAPATGAVILVKPGCYYEKLKITKPNISLVGTNPLTTIIYGYEADTGDINGNLLAEVSLPGEGGAFRAENITFFNKGPEWNKTWKNVERRSIALALKNVQEGFIKNCIFLGQQDTMYLRSGRAYFQDSYIEGEVDFICGGATALFDNCHIHSIYCKDGGYIAAAAPVDAGSAAAAAGFANGYVFRNCVFTGSPELKDKKVFLGRGAWTGGSDGSKNPAKVVYLGCDIGSHVDAKGWEDWDNVNTAAKQFFREYKDTGAGSVAAETATRKFLTDAEYQATYADTEKILGFKPAMPY